MKRRQCCGTGCLSWLEFFHPRFRIPDPELIRRRIPDPGSGSESKSFSIFNPKTDDEVLIIKIWTVHLGSWFQGVKNAPDPGSGSATRTGDIWFSCSLCAVKWFDICRTRSTKETKQLWFYLLDENWTVLWSSRRIRIQSTGDLFLSFYTVMQNLLTFVHNFRCTFIIKLPRRFTFITYCRWKNDRRYFCWYFVQNPQNPYAFTFLCTLSLTSCIVKKDIIHI